jgi:hypothetical protein
MVSQSSAPGAGPLPMMNQAYASRPFIASHNKVIGGQTMKNLSAATWARGSRFTQSSRHFVLCAQLSTRGLHGSFTPPPVL